MVPSPWGPLPWWLVYTPIVILGLSLGSFANVLIWRLPREESMVQPPSHCPKCGRLIPPLENIPLLSFLVLRGRCRGCHEPISVRYPLIELAAGILALLAVEFFGVSYATFAYGMLFIALLALIIIDLEHWLLPFAITIPLTIIALCGAIFFQLRPLADSLLGMLVGFAVFMAMVAGGKWIFKKDAMGGGDVVFGVMAGAFLGWKLTLLMIFLASLLGTLTIIPLLLLGKNISGRSIPFGPFLAVALVVALFLGEPILNWYIHLVLG
jgi:leader peptidase (prepilin peptidase) / N-methyltransferase